MRVATFSTPSPGVQSLPCTSVEEKKRRKSGGSSKTKKKDMSKIAPEVGEKAAEEEE